MAFGDAAMSLHSAIGIAILTSMLSLFLGALGVATRQEPGITVHSLEYFNGIVRQERTVIAGGKTFFAKWDARVETGNGLEIVCIGSGSHDYVEGYKTISMGVKDWTGDSECDLSDGDYRLIATWHWGNSHTTHKSAIFTVKN